MEMNMFNMRDNNYVIIIMFIVVSKD